ncbi:hypothetical protein PoB_000685100 [Plakobranchus ocellatus]|uniref:Uncharacterized protein n=1 Tax=Plakobranchus ocellatus TaxID=259542 RepID=A0AAV3XZG6_9GAST|nr:hypothetical protein PoB_000685100 [Plakobranchus ocellatus]
MAIKLSFCSKTNPINFASPVTGSAGRPGEGLIVAAAACRPVLRTISEKRFPLLMRRVASPPGDPRHGRGRA